MAIALPGRGATLSVKKDSDWLVVPGVSDVSLTGGAAAVNEISHFGGQVQVTGFRGLGTVNVTFAVFNPQHPANRRIREIADKGENGSWRVNSKDEALLAQTASGVTFAAAKDTGAVTLVGAPAFSWQPGMVVVAGSNGYIVESLGTDGNPAVVRDLDGKGPATAQTASVYSVKVPKMQIEFSAAISESDSFSLTADNLLSGNMTLVPNVRVPDWAATI